MSPYVLTLAERVMAYFGGEKHEIFKTITGDSGLGGEPVPGGGWQVESTLYPSVSRLEKV